MVSLAGQVFLKVSRHYHDRQSWILHMSLDYNFKGKFLKHFLWGTYNRTVDILYALSVFNIHL